MAKITPEILKAAGFEPIDQDKFCRLYVLETRFCTVRIWCTTYGSRPTYTLGGITYPADRVHVTSPQMIYKAAELLGADTVALERIESVLNE